MVCDGFEKLFPYTCDLQRGYTVNTRTNFKAILGVVIPAPPSNLTNIPILQYNSMEIHACMYTHVCACFHNYTHVHTHIHKDVYIYNYTHTSIHRSIHPSLHAYINSTCIHTRAPLEKIGSMHYSFDGAGRLQLKLTEAHCRSPCLRFEHRLMICVKSSMMKESLRCDRSGDLQDPLFFSAFCCRVT